MPCHIIPACIHFSRRRRNKPDAKMRLPSFLVLPFSYLFRLFSTARAARFDRLQPLPAILATVLSAAVGAPLSARAQTGSIAPVFTTPAGITPLDLKLDTELTQQSKKNRRNATVFGVADRVEGQLDTEIKLDGGAEIRKPGMVIKADHIRYVDVDDEVFASGAVRVQRDGDIFSGSELQIRLDDNHGFFLKPEYSLLRRGGRGHAARADFIDQDRSHLTNATYTVCTAENSGW